MATAILPKCNSPFGYFIRIGNPSEEISEFVKKDFTLGGIVF
jgi:hypothetical protein